MRLPVQLLLVLLLPLGGCNRPRYDTPQNAYTSFHQRMQRSDYTEAWKALSEPTRQALTSRAQEVARASGGAVKADAMIFFFANVPPPADFTEVRLVTQEDQTARVLVVGADQSQKEVRLVRESSGWKIDLTHSLQP